MSVVSTSGRECQSSGLVVDVRKKQCLDQTLNTTGCLFIDPPIWAILVCILCLTPVFCVVCGKNIYSLSLKSSKFGRAADKASHGELGHVRYLQCFCSQNCVRKTFGLPPKTRQKYFCSCQYRGIFFLLKRFNLHVFDGGVHVYTGTVCPFHAKHYR